MKIYTVSDLRKRAGELIQAAGAGQFAVVTKHGKPVFLAVPFDSATLESGVRISIAIKLLSDGSMTLGQAAKLSGLGIEDMIERAGAAGISLVHQLPQEIDEELAVIAHHGRSR